jgi:SAM-dependent methyltransferase
MNWKVKGLGQTVLSRVPYAATLNYWGQKYITRAHKECAGVVRDRLAKARWFVEQVARHGGCRLSQAQFYEFGAGWNLAGPLALYCLGADRQIIVDVSPCARLELVNGVLAELCSLRDTLPRAPDKPLRSLAELEERFGIVYRAPADARHTGLPRGSIDCISDTYTFEHVPAADVLAITEECHRILKPGGINLSMIDYQDHYSYRDPRISVYNFLQYSERRWRWFNSPLHYQNRWRHSQYRQMFTDCGFEVLAEELQLPSSHDLERLKSLPLSAEFRSFAFEDLAVLSSRMVCRRMGVKDSPRSSVPEHSGSTV